MRINGRHTDWPWPLCYIPRRWTSFDGKPPLRFAGNTEDLKPIPDPGTWWIGGPKGWPLFFTMKTNGNWHFRIGIVRWDDVDHYWEIFTFTIKHYKVSN